MPFRRRGQSPSVPEISALSADEFTERLLSTTARKMIDVWPFLDLPLRGGPGDDTELLYLARPGTALNTRLRVLPTVFPEQVHFGLHYGLSREVVIETPHADRFKYLAGCVPDATFMPLGDGHAGNVLAELQTVSGVETPYPYPGSTLARGEVVGLNRSEIDPEVVRDLLLRVGPGDERLHIQWNPSKAYLLRDLFVEGSVVAMELDRIRPGVDAYGIWEPTSNSFTCVVEPPLAT